jgi:hypothetical protein
MKLCAALLVGTASIVACSAGNNQTGLGQNGTGAGSNGSGNGGSGAIINSGNGGDGIIGASGAGNGGTADTGSGGDTSGQCDNVVKPEQVVQYSPIAIYIMQDRSTSMNTGLAGGSPQSWGYSTDAINAFVTDPSSSTLDVGIGFFPPLSNGQGACDGSDCGQPVVPIGPLSSTASQINSAMTQATPTLLPPLFTPTECALRGMINQCLQHQQQTKEQCVAVLITDGTPTSCDTTAQDLVNIVAQGKSQGVTTFALGLTGSDLNFLNQVAQAGGGGQAIDVSGGTSAFLNALNAIRGKVAVGTALPCTWKIPPPPAGQQFDPNKVNVRFTPPGGSPQDFGYVNQADCARANNAWYFDDPNNPTQVLACPTTCDMLKASSGAEVDVSFGCARIPASIM